MPLSKHPPIGALQLLWRRCRSHSQHLIEAVDTTHCGYPLGQNHSTVGAIAWWRDHQLWGRCLPAYTRDHRRAAPARDAARQIQAFGVADKSVEGSRRARQMISSAMNHTMRCPRAPTIRSGAPVSGRYKPQRTPNLRGVYVVNSVLQSSVRHKAGCCSGARQNPPQAGGASPQASGRCLPMRVLPRPRLASHVTDVPVDRQVVGSWNLERAPAVLRTSRHGGVPHARHTIPGPGRQTHRIALLPRIRSSLVSALPATPVAVRSEALVRGRNLAACRAVAVGVVNIGVRHIR